MLLTIAAAIFVFGLLVLVHEFGHFITAKMTGMRVDEFAIGFGPKIWGKQKGETLYSLRAVPLGGFNRIAGMDNNPDEADAGERAYFRRPLWARMIVIVAGSMMNFILPVLLFFGIFLFNGAMEPVDSNVVGSVIPDRPAIAAGIKPGDRILSIDGKTIEHWKDISTAVSGNTGEEVTVVFERSGERMSAGLVPKYDASSQRALIGVTAELQHKDVGFFESIQMALQKTIYVFTAMIAALVGMVQGTVGASELSGPVGVAQMAGEVAHQGFMPLLNFAAFLSINLGIVNLLPIPALDGGHFVMLCLEGVRGKPVSPKVMEYVQTFGFSLLVLLMLYATFNDVARSLF